VTSIEILGNGDVRLELRREDGRTDSRHFRAHFGHVVEVRGDMLRRVGADLSYREPALLVRATLAETVREAGSVAQAGVAMATDTPTPFTSMSMATSMATSTPHPMLAEPSPGALAAPGANTPAGFGLDPAL
jgi:hypothetical protein